MNSRALVLVLVSTLILPASAFASKLFFSNEIKALINPCGEALSKEGLPLSELNTSETSGEMLLARLSRADIAARFHQTPKHGVTVHLTDNLGRILLGVRKGSHGANRWGAPGGNIEAGEKIFDTAKRETFEETGVEIGEITFLGVTFDHFPEKNTTYFTYHVAAKILSGTPVVKEPNKLQGNWVWHAPSKLPQPLFGPLKNFVAGKPVKLESPKKAKSPHVLFRETYKGWLDIPVEKLAHVSATELTNQLVAIYSLKGAFIEGIVEKVEAVTRDVGGIESEYKTFHTYKIKLQNETVLDIPKREILGFRVSLPEEANVQEFSFQYKDYPRAYSTTLKRGDKIALLAKQLGRLISIEGTVEEVQKLSQQSYGDNSPDYFELLKILSKDGIRKNILSTDIKIIHILREGSDLIDDSESNEIKIIK